MNFGKNLIVTLKNDDRRRSGAVVCTATPQQEGSGFDSGPGAFLCGLCMSAGVLYGFLPEGEVR